MSCVYKKYEIKTKMVQGQWLQLKLKFLLSYNMKINLRWLGTESYWTSIKIKISMSCVYKKYGIKTKMVQEQ